MRIHRHNNGENGFVRPHKTHLPSLLTFFLSDRCFFSIILSSRYLRVKPCSGFHGGSTTYADKVSREGLEGKEYYLSDNF